MEDLKGKVALVTGVANKRSIAYSIAEDLARYGTRVVVAYLPTGRDGEEAKIRVLTRDMGPELIVPLDVADPQSLPVGGFGRYIFLYHLHRPVDIVEKLGKGLPFKWESLLVWGLGTCLISFVVFTLWQARRMERMDVSG